MSLIVWPDDMPQSMYAPDFSTSVAGPRLKVEMEAGPAKLRRRSSAQTRRASGVIRCTVNQIGRLERFWREDTLGGVLPFMFPAQVYNNMWLLDDNGEQLLTEDDEEIIIADWWLVQFAEEPVWTPHHRSAVWAVNLSLTVLP